MAETEVSKEVSKMVATEEKYGLDMSSYQDLPKLDCNGINHHNPASEFDNSYVFVSGDDVDSKDVEAEVSSVLLESDPTEGKGQGVELDSQTEKIDVVNGEFHPLNKTENRIIEHSNEVPPLVIVDDKDVEAEGLSVLPESDVIGLKDQGAELDSQIEKFDAQPLNEVENKNIDQSNGDLPLVSDVEAEVSSVLPGSDTAGVKDQGAKLDFQIENVDAQSLNEEETRRIEQCNEDIALENIDNKEVETEVSSLLPESNAVAAKDQGEDLGSQIMKSDVVGGEFQPLNEVETRDIEQTNGDLLVVNVDNKDVEAEILSALPDSDPAVVKDQDAESDSQTGKFAAVGGEFQPLIEAETRSIEQSNGDLPSENVDDKDAVQSVRPDSDPAGVKDQGAELDSQIEKSDALDGELQPLNEVEARNIEQTNGDLPLVNVGDKDVETEVLSVVPESDVAGVKDQRAELDSKIEQSDAIGLEFHPLNEVENRRVEHGNGDPTSVNDGTSKHERSHQDGEGTQVAVDDPLKENTESLAETEFEQVQDPDGKIETMAEAEEEKAMHQNEKVEVVAEVEEEKYNVLKPESSTVPVENQESQVVALEVVAESGSNRESNNVLLNINSSHSGNDECQDQSKLSVSELLEACQGSQETVVVEREMKDVTTDTEDEVNSMREMSEVAEIEASPTSSLSLDLEPYPVHSKDKTLGEEAKIDVLESQQGDTVTGNNIQVLIGQMDESKSVVGTDCHVQTVCDPVLKEKNVDLCVSEVTSSDCHVQTVCDSLLEENNEGLCVSEVDNVVQYAGEIHEQPDRSEVTCDTMPSETKTETSNAHAPFSEIEMSESETAMPSETKTEASNAHAPLSEIEISESETVGAVSASHNDSPKSQIIERVFPAMDSGIRCPPKEASSGSDSTLDVVVLTEKEPDFQGDEAHAVNSVSIGKAEVADCPPASDDEGAVSFGTEVSDSSNVNKEAASIELDVKVTDDLGAQLDGSAGNSNENLFVQEKEDNGTSQSNEICVASAGDSSADAIDGKEESVKIKTKPFNFMIRVPRFDDENLREQIRLAKLHVDEKTKLRDAIQIQIQEIRANSQIHGIDYEYAKSEARSARKLVRSKRMEIDSLQSVINKAKNALSIEDIDSQIYNMEHMIQHETLPLKEEKQLIREIKQLKQLREQLSSNMGSQDEIKQAVEQREEVEERLKILRKELDILKHRVLKAEATAGEAEKKYDDENKKVKELQARFRAADDVRQAAYAQWQNLRKELSKKSEHFFKYKDDAAVASNYAFSRDTEALYRLCTNQVENLMELWNMNEEFRREYVRFNARSTVRRFGSLDGRPLGPDEEPPILPSYGNERTSRLASTPVKAGLASPIEMKQDTSNENVTLDGKSMKKEMESKYQKVTKVPAITVQPSNGLDTLPVKELIYEEPPVKSREEIESLRREEEKRREEAEAKLKEQRRLEALAKAHEARERKKRQAEKMQMRAELKTQKEAEQREKEREKRLRKKERKKAGVTDGNEINNHCESAPSSESAAENKDLEVKDTPSVGPKKPQKPWLFAKQSKTKTIPPPLRNRNKKKWQQWMWVGITSFIILVLFWLGNIGVFSNVALKRRGPIH